MRKLLKRLDNDWNSLNLTDINQMLISDEFKNTLKNKDSVLFDKRLLTEKSLRDYFRIFANKAQTNVRPTNITSTNSGTNETPDNGAPQIVQVYMDSSCLNNGCDNAQAGVGI